MRTLIAALAAAVAVAAGAAHAETCMKSGEEKGAMGTVCTYRCTFGETSRNIGPAQLCPLTAEASAARLNGTPPRQAGGACLKQGERTTGMSKQCLYDCAGTPKVETVGAAQLCPLSVR